MYWCKELGEQGRGTGHREIRTVIREELGWNTRDFVEGKSERRKSEEKMKEGSTNIPAVTEDYSGAAILYNLNQSIQARKEPGGGP